MLYRTPAPHSIGGNQVSLMMITLVAATLPGMFVQTYFFGWGVLIQVIFASFIALLTEAAILHLRQRPIKKTLFDGSALVTGWLIGLAIPSVAPWWLTMTAVIFAIIFAKHIYGGLGYNPFNPAMAGYVLVLISFPVQMTAWLPVSALLTESLGFIDSVWLIFTEQTSNGLTVNLLRTGVDGFTLATPLDTLKTDLNNGLMVSEILNKNIFGSFAGKGWEYVNLAYLIGGLFLLYKKIISWQIPFSMLITLFVFSFFFSVFTPEQYPGPMLHLLSGATMMGAFFIATDPVSASTTPKGRIVYGIGIGILVYVIRTFGGYPEALAFAVLLMNLSAPTIDHFTQPEVYGHGSSQEKERTNNRGNI